MAEKRQINIRISSELYDKLNKLAKKNVRSITGELSLAIAEYTDKYLPDDEDVNQPKHH